MNYTLLISGQAIKKVFSMRDAIKAVESGFREYGKGRVQMPPKVYMYFTGPDGNQVGDLRVMPSYLPGFNAAGVKIVNVHPNNPQKHGLPAVMGIYPYMDPASGFCLAVMDATYMTNLRTGAAGGIAAKYLAKKDSKVIGFIGAGHQAETQLEALMAVKENGHLLQLERVFVYDKAPEISGSFAEKVSKAYDIEVDVASKEDTIRNSDILITTTPVRQPVVENRYVMPGTHINAIGADAEGKEELEPEILKRSKIIIDEWQQASHSGEINVPLKNGVITQEDICANIGEIVIGKKQGRVSSEDITIFDSTGLGIQDLVCEREAFNRVKENLDELEKQELIAKFDFLPTED